jgi:hypothetical protein
MGRFSRSRGLLYFMILMMLVVILVRMFSLGTSNVKELNSQQFLAAVRTHQVVTNPTNPDKRLTVHDQSQELTGELKGGQQRRARLVTDDDRAPAARHPQNSSSHPSI